MMRLTFLILLISINCVKSNCDAEHSTTETVNEVSEKTKSFSANPVSIQSKAENKEIENEASKTNEDSEEIRISRSSSDRTTGNEPQSKNSSEIRSTEVSLTEKIAINEMISEPQNKQSNIEVKEQTRKSDSANITEEGKKYSDKEEKQLEELPKIASLATEIEDRKAGDRSEASAETKLSNNEKASSKVDENNRNFNTNEIKEKSDESSLNKSLGTRRMISNLDHIIIDTKMRADTISKAEPEVKTTFNQNLNTYNNFNEFETYSKLTGALPTDPSSIPEKNSFPVITNLGTQEIFNQQYLPKFHPRPELNINFPNINSDFQGPRDLPIYLKLKQDEYQWKHQFMGTPTNQPINSAEENTNFNPGYQQKLHKSLSMLDTSGTFINKQFENFRFQTKNQVPRIYQNQEPTNYKSFMENRQLETLNQVLRNQGQQFYQNGGKLNMNFKHLGDREPRNDEKRNPKMPLNNNNQGNYYPIIRQPELKMNTKKYTNNKQLRYDDNNRFVNPYLQQPSPRHNNVLNAPARYIDNIIPTNVKLFKKLANASEHPRKLPLKSYNNNNIQKYPYFIDLNYLGDLSFYNIRYMPDF